MHFDICLDVEWFCTYLQICSHMQELLVIRSRHGMNMLTDLWFNAKHGGIFHDNDESTLEFSCSNHLISFSC